MANFRDSLTFKNYDRDRIIIDSIAARLTAEENAFRNRIINSIADTHKPFFAANDAEKAMVKTLQSKNALAIEEDGSVSSIYPVSAKPSRHLVTLADGRTVYCMCAIDALGCAFTFDKTSSSHRPAATAASRSASRSRIKRYAALCRTERLSACCTPT